MEEKFDGIVALYINFKSEDHLTDKGEQVIEMIRRLNQVVIDKLNTTSKYQLMIVPTANEASRIEKIDFSEPFPRYSKVTHADLSEDKDTNKEAEE